MRGIYAVSAVGLFYLALTDIPLADATALIFITPIIVTILSPFMLKEHVGVRRWVAVIIGFGGVLLIVQPGFQEVRMGTLAGLAAGRPMNCRRLRSGRWSCAGEGIAMLW